MERIIEPLEPSELQRQETEQNKDITK